MRKFALVALLALLSAGVMVGVAHFAHSKRASTNSAIDAAFNTWLNTQNKIYASPAEKSYRRSVFAANYDKIAQMNQVYTHRSALNQFADMTDDEIVAKYTGLNYDSNAVRNTVTLKESVKQEGVDWRTKGAVNAIKNQESCGSCWAFSAVSSLESAWFLAHGSLLNLAEQQLVDCGSVTGNQGCNGGWMDYAFKYVQQVGGIAQTSDYPYTARDGNCAFTKDMTKASVSGYSDVPASNCDQLLAALNAHPVSVAIAATGDFMRYSSGIFEITNCGEGLNHGVTAVGYGSEGGKNFWIVRNSWGQWGEGGYIRMSRDVQQGPGICGICKVASYPQAG